MKYLKLLMLLALVTFFACEDDGLSKAEQLKKDISKIEDYLADSNLTAQSTESGLYYIITEQGTGEKPDLYSVVEVNYTGKLLDGTEFDSGTVEQLPLYYYIDGWKEGIQLFNEGGKGKLFIPSALGYGTTSTGTIPANSVLVFDIELINVD